MPLQKSCPLKFGTAINTEGLLMEIPCIGKSCAWFFDNQCAVVSIAKGLGTEYKKRTPRGTAAD